MDNVHPFEDRNTIAHEAREWLIRLDGDEPLTPAEVDEMHVWGERSPAHRQELLRITAFWNDASQLTELAIPLYSNARPSNSPVGDLLSWLSQGLNTARGVTASVATVCLVLGVVVFSNGWYPQPIDATNGIYATAIGEMRVKKLAEGSVLHINTDSQVQVDFSEPIRKIRLLRGEAHFEVAHNSEWPFEVYAGKGMVKAVGTAFSVRLNQDDVLDVIVTDGRVALAAAVVPEPQPTGSTQEKTASPLVLPVKLETFGTLSRGEGLSFSTQNSQKNNQRLAQKDIARHLSWRDGYLVFSGEPLSLVVKELNRYMPITVEISDPALRELPIGGRFKVGELEALLDVLETNFGIQVSRLDDQRIQLSPKF